MAHKKRPNGRDERGTLWIDGRCTPGFVTGDVTTWPDMTTSTPGPWTAAAIKAALQNDKTHKAFLHLCNTFAEHHQASFASCLLDVDDSLPLTDEQEQTLKICDDLHFELCASLADFLNLLGAEKNSK
jgi:hypothetical protein